MTVELTPEPVTPEPVTPEPETPEQEPTPAPVTPDPVTPEPDPTPVVEEETYGGKVENVEFTKAQAMAVPVINNVDRIYTLDTLTLQA